MGIPTLVMPSAVAEPVAVSDEHQELVEFLRAQFDTDFSLWDATTGELRTSAHPMYGDLGLQSQLVRVVGERGTTEIISETDAAVLVAIPAQLGMRRRVVAIAPFATRPWSRTVPLEPLARWLNCSPGEARRWWRKQQVWHPGSLLRAANLAIRCFAAERRERRLEREVESLTENLTATYEEISLLYTLIQHLRISATDTQLGQAALEWLQECVTAESLLAQYLPVARPNETTYKARTEPVLLVSGEQLLDEAEFCQVLAYLQVTAQSPPRVLNANVTSSPDWPFPKIRQLIVVPLVENQNLYGWMAAINHRTGGEFGSVQAKLLSSVATILGIHAGNRELYRQQAEFLASVVRALVSAIDAKDPYTCGHSDRVARIAVRLAREMNCTPQMLHTIYMAGLLHDIGKIGIDDQVLRKPGALTKEEFEHIKTHPELGFRILADLRQMADVLPIVLHHHEQWDGNGYPGKLRGEQSPLLARITAVADAFDAMTSDRPYRKGMPIEKVEEIFRKGAGQQWDPRVIDAYFRCRDDILRIARRERANLPLDVERWFQ